MYSSRSIAVIISAALLLAACAQTTASTEPIAPQPTASVGDSCPSSGEPMASAKLYIEHNATDADTGVHGLFGGDGFTSFCLRGPDGDILATITPNGPLGELGLADVFFESREPSNDEYPISKLRERFPAGTYQAAGVDVEGVTWIGSARFTHAIPAEPIITAPALSPEAEAIEAVVDDGPLLIQWDRADTDLDGQPIEISGYQVIVTSISVDDPDGWSKPVFDIRVPSTATEVLVPEGFLESGSEYELELLALESSGNQTITLGFFGVR